MRQLIADYRLLMADVYEVAGLSRRTSEDLAAVVGQTAARWHVLSVLSEEALSVAASARRLGLARQSVQRVVDDLRADGLVRLQPDPADRRAPRVGLTERGREVFAELQASSEQKRTRLLRASGLSASDLQQARSTLRVLAGALRDAASP